jgi:hypothetical protein
MSAMYVLANFLMYCCIIMFLKEFKEIRWYYARKWYIIFLLPIFNFMVFWFRLAGIINSIKGKQSWRVRDFNEEWESFGRVVGKDFEKLNTLLDEMRNEVNYDEENI